MLYFALPLFVFATVVTVVPAGGFLTAVKEILSTYKLPFSFASFVPNRTSSFKSLDLDFI